MRAWRVRGVLKHAGPCCLLLALWFATAPAIAAHRQIFLLGGQSNMVGTGTNPFAPAAAPFASPLADVPLFYGVSSDSRPPNAYAWNPLASGSGGQFGPELSFGNALHAIDPNGNFALIKHARGGSNVHTDWNPLVQNNVYADFRSTVDQALEQLALDGDTYEIAGLIWVQGIRDGLDLRTPEQYAMDLERLIADMRLRYAPQMPAFIARMSSKMIDESMTTIVTGGRGDETEVNGLLSIRHGHEMVAANDPLAFLIDTDDFSIGDPKHFDSSGQIALGLAFADSYYRNVLVPEPGSGYLAIALLTLFLAAGPRRLFSELSEHAQA